MNMYIGTWPSFIGGNGLWHFAVKLFTKSVPIYCIWNNASKLKLTSHRSRVLLTLCDAIYRRCKPEKTVELIEVLCMVQTLGVSYWWMVLVIFHAFEYTTQVYWLFVLSCRSFIRSMLPYSIVEVSTIYIYIIFISIHIWFACDIFYFIQQYFIFGFLANAAWELPCELPPRPQHLTHLPPQYRPRDTRSLP